MTFKLIETRELSDIQSIAKLYRHDETGAEVLRLINDDTNKAFTISFNTPPYNDNGIAHILEHSVLNGSKKYPSKEPFVELIKGSLNTFVNAMTFSDKTVYPVASTNQQDFHNLMSVYLDAVFQPKIYTDPQILQQEGWHYHLENIEDELIYKGVVYNEMKGAMASPERHLYFEVTKALYPNTIYANESGGLPNAIPSLTQEEFIEFHQKYYHPSQSQTILYGDLDDEAAFALLEEYFSSAGKGPEKVDLAIDVPYVDDVKVEATYSITEGDDPTDKDYLALAWHANVAEDIHEALALGIVMDVLFGNNQAPIKKALLDANIAGDISGYHDQEGYFAALHITAKYTSSEKMDEFRKIVDTKLQEIVKEGIDIELVHAALNQFAFKLKEMVISESNPRGVLYAMNALQTWQYGFAPYAYLEFSKYIDDIRERFENGYFEELIQLYMIDNNHRVQVILKADPGLNDRQEKALHESLQSYKASLEKEELEAIVEATRALIKRQNTPDSAEDLAQIPALKKEDLTTETESYPLEQSVVEDVMIYHAEQFTAGIDYLSVLFDIDDFETDDFAWLNLLASLLGKLRTTHYSSKELLTKMDLYTGGISGAVQIYEQPTDIKTYFTIRGKALEEMDVHLVELMHEIMLNTQFDEVDEMINVVQRMISSFEETINYSAHSLASQRALSQIRAISNVAETISGIKQYNFLKTVLKQLKSTEFNEVIDTLKALYQRLGNKARLNIFYIGSVERKEILSQITLSKFSALPVLPIGAKVLRVAGKKEKEAFITAQDVNYVALANVLCDFELTGPYNVLSKALRFDYLWNNIRVKGGAYGALYALRRNGAMTLASYRDPNIDKTLEVYFDIPSFINRLEINDTDLFKYIIGAMSELNQPLSASDKGYTAFTLHHAGITVEDRIRLKEEILETTVEQLKELQSTYETLLLDPAVVVIGNKAQIEALSETFDIVHELY